MFKEPEPSRLRRTGEMPAVIVTDDDGHVITNSADVNTGDMIHTRLQSGSISAEVKTKESE